MPSCREIAERTIKESGLGSAFDRAEAIGMRNKPVNAPMIFISIRRLSFSVPNPDNPDVVTHSLTVAVR
jgi:hypothetical protein